MRAERARRVHERAAGTRQRARELRVAEHERDVEHGDDAVAASIPYGPPSGSPRFQPKYIPEMT